MCGRCNEAAAEDRWVMGMPPPVLSLLRVRLTSDALTLEPLLLGLRPNSLVRNDGLLSPRPSSSS